MMKLNNYLVNKTLYFHALKQHLLLAKISLITFGILFVTSIALDDSYLVFSSFVFLISCVVLPTCYPVIIYDYLHDSTKASHIRSMPIKMSSLFLTYLCAGLTLVLGTLMIELITLLVIPDTLVEVEFLLVVPVLAIYYYVFGILASLFAGNKKMALLLTIVFYGLPVLLVVLVSYVSIHHAFGLTYLRVNSDLIYFLMPLVSGLKFLTYDPEWPYFIAHLLQIIVILGLCFTMMKYRHEEYIGDSFVVKQASLIIRLGLLVALTCGLYLVGSYSIQAASFNDYILRLDTLFVASGCLCAIIIELIFNKKVVLKTFVSFYLPTIAAMIFILHFNGDSLSHPRIIDDYDESTISIFDGYGNSYASVSIEDTKDMVEYIFDHYKSEPKNYENNRILFDILLYGKETFNYEFVLEKEEFNQLLKQFSNLRNVYYDQGLTFDFISNSEFIVAEDLVHDEKRVIYGSNYKNLVKEVESYFKDENYWLNHKGDTQSSYQVLFYNTYNEYENRIDSLPNNHPFIEAIDSGRYDDESYNLFIKESLKLLEESTNYEYLVDDSNLMVEISEIYFDKYDYDYCLFSQDSFKLKVWADVYLKTLYHDGNYTREEVTLTFKQDRGLVYIASIEFEESFYESYGE